eukprot:3118097-Amphidinium_carterae.1
MVCTICLALIALDPGLLVPREGAVVPAVVPWPPAGRMCLRRPFDLYPAGNTACRTETHLPHRSKK